MDEVGVFGLLKALGDGKVMDDLHEQLQELLLAVRTSHEGGKVVLTITVEPDKDLEVSRVAVEGDVSGKIPRLKRGGEMFYLTDDCRLTRRNPRQPALPAGTMKMPSPEEQDELDGKSRASGERL